MTRSLLLLTSFLLFFLLSTAKDNGSDNDLQTAEPDFIIRQIFADYQKVLTTTKDEHALTNLFINESEWQDLMKLVKEKQPNCISLDESEYDVNVNFNTYRELISSKIVIKQLFVSKIEYNSSCGNLFTIPRVMCAVQYNDNKVVNVPFLLIKTLDNQYKIVRNFLNFKIFPNE